MKSGDQFYITISLQASLSVLNLMRNQFGGVAQLVRVPASHAGGRRFEPRCLHQRIDILLSKNVDFHIFTINYSLFTKDKWLF